MSGNPFMRLVTGFGDQGQESAQIDAWWELSPPERRRATALLSEDIQAGIISA